MYLKGAQTHAERLNDLNFKTLLNEMPGGNQYRATGNGRLIEKNDNMDFEDGDMGGSGRRPGRGSGWQFGRGRRGRDARRGYMTRTGRGRAGATADLGSRDTRVQDDSSVDRDNEGSQRSMVQGDRNRDSD